MTDGQGDPECNKFCNAYFKMQQSLQNRSCIEEIIEMTLRTETEGGESIYAHSSLRTALQVTQHTYPVYSTVHPRSENCKILHVQRGERGVLLPIWIIINTEKGMEI